MDKDEKVVAHVVRKAFSLHDHYDLMSPYGKIVFRGNILGYDYHIYLNDDEYSRVIQTLIRLKNSLISQGRYTDGVDDVLCKVLSAKKRKLKIKYI